MILFVCGFLYTSCNSTKKLKENEYLVSKNHIISNQKGVNTDGIYGIIKQKPNKKLFGIAPFYLWLYNQTSEESINKKIEKKQPKIDAKNKKIYRKNKKRISKGKNPKPYKENIPFEQKVRENIGEPPTILDTSKINQSSSQIHQYLVRKGFFNNSVKDSIVFHNNKKAEVYYIISAKVPYKVLSYRVHSKASELGEMVDKISSTSIVKKNQIFDVDKLNSERNRVFDLFLNSGYYSFKKDNIIYKVDSSFSDSSMVKVEMEILPNKSPDTSKNIRHQIYTINEINIVVNHRENKNDNSYKTLTKEEHHSVNIYYASDPIIKPKNLAQYTTFNRGDIYKKDEIVRTIKKLTSIAIIKGVYTFYEIINEQDGKLSITFFITTSPKQNFQADISGTNSGSILGIETGIRFTHKNIFRGGERLQLSLNAAIEAVPSFTEDDPDFSSVSLLQNGLNSLVLNPELRLLIPRFLFFNNQHLLQNASPSTQIGLAFSTENNVNYSSRNYNLTYGYSWSFGKTKHQIYPINISATDIVSLSSNFLERLESLNDIFLVSRFTDNISPATSYNFTFNNQNSANKRNFIFFHANFEVAGNLLRGIFNLRNETKDSEGRYRLFDIPFAQYVKSQFDFRYYHNIDTKTQIVYRINTGIGVPLANSPVALPFDKAFYVGGANGLRAWHLRAVGPGSFQDSVPNFSSIGELVIESNIEYRFDLLGFVKGALFADAGNIWLLDEDVNRPGGVFRSNFLSQMAVDAGFGLRFDFDFLLVRFDMAVGVRNPSLESGERWFFQPKTKYKEYKESISTKPANPYPFQLNVGIGYPF